MNSEPRPSLAGSLRRPRGRDRWRRLLPGFLGLILLFAAIYAEEDWRGQRAWEHYKEVLRAKGEVLDWNAYIPAPVPDEQNVMKAPRMEEWFSVPSYRNWRFPTTNDLAKRLENPLTTTEETNLTTAAGYLAWSDQFGPEFETMRAAFTRPSVQFVGDYRQPRTIPSLNLPTLRMVIFTLTQRAKSHLLLGETEKAWRDLVLLLDFGRLVPDKPTGNPMIVHSYALWAKRGIVMRAADIVHQGLESHTWHEPQLTAFEERLKEIDFIGLQAESWKTVRTLETTSSLEFVRQVNDAEDPYTNKWRRAKEPTNLILWFGPRGWTYLWLVHLGDGFQRASEVLGGIRGAAIPTHLEQVTGRFPGREGLPLLAYNQVIVDETRIVCALERYRFLHNQYPESLNALAPQFLDKVPHDLIDGQPLRYRRTIEGKFSLYSIGWNETDDGGQVAPGVDRGHNLTIGDWVWATFSFKPK